MPRIPSHPAGPDKNRPIRVGLNRLVAVRPLAREPVRQPGQAVWLREARQAGLRAAASKAPPASHATPSAPAVTSTARSQPRPPRNPLPGNRLPRTRDEDRSSGRAEPRPPTRPAPAKRSRAPCEHFRPTAGRARLHLPWVVTANSGPSAGRASKRGPIRWESPAKASPARPEPLRTMDVPARSASRVVPQSESSCPAAESPPRRAFPKEVHQASPGEPGEPREPREPRETRQAIADRPVSARSLSEPPGLRSPWEREASRCPPVSAVPRHRSIVETFCRPAVRRATRATHVGSSRTARRGEHIYPPHNTRPEGGLHHLPIARTRPEAKDRCPTSAIQFVSCRPLFPLFL